MARQKREKKHPAEAYDEDGLSPRERRVVDRYLIHLNKGRAIREAIASDRNVNRRHGFDREIFDRPQVKLVIDREIAESRRRHKLQAEWVLEQLAYQCRFDPRKLFREDGSPKDITELDEATAACIVGIEVEDIYEMQGEGRERHRVYVGQVRKYKFSSRTEALALAMKHLNILDTGGARQQDRLNEVIAAMREGPVGQTIEGQGEVK